MSTLVDAMQKDARRRLKYKQDDLAGAIANVLEAESDGERHRAQVVVRRAEKGVATYTAKVLCPHTYITHKEIRVMGQVKHTYSCNACKTHILSRLPL